MVSMMQALKRSLTATGRPARGARPVKACAAGQQQEPQAREHGWSTRSVVACLLAAAAAVATAGVLAVPASRRALLRAGLAAGGASLAWPLRLRAEEAGAAEFKVVHSEEEWRQLLMPERYKVLREAATERPLSSALNFEKRPGTFVCAGCQSKLFDMGAKFNSGTGWPSFYQALPGAVVESPDYSIPFMPRTEVRSDTCIGHLGHVFDGGPQAQTSHPPDPTISGYPLHTYLQVRCATCGGHLGHVFDDAPQTPTGLRFCMNGLAMDFEPAEGAAGDA